MSKFIETAGIVPFCTTMKMDSVSDDLDKVDGFSKPNADIMKEIKEEEEARIREEKKNAAKNQVSEDMCRQKYEAINLRKKRAEEKAYADRLKARTDENKKYQAGDLDTEEHRKNLEKIQDTYDTEMRKISLQFEKDCDNLRTANPDAYRKVTRGW